MSNEIPNSLQTFTGKETGTNGVVGLRAGGSTDTDVAKPGPYKYVAFKVIEAPLTITTFDHVKGVGPANANSQYAGTAITSFAFPAGAIVEVHFTRMVISAGAALCYVSGKALDTSP